ETQITRIWSDVLGIRQEQIGIYDNFFKLGGNSILIIKLKNKLAVINEFKNITIADFFKYHTIDKLIEYVHNNKHDEIKFQHLITGIDNDIAIIAASGAFSGCNNLSGFWEIIQNGQEGIREYSLDECRHLGVSESLLQCPNYVAVGGHVPDIDLFDPQFWGLSGSEAKQTNPQIRKFLEHCWYLLEKSGYICQRKELNVGVFAGSGDNPYFYDNLLNGEDRDNINSWEASSMNNKDALATKAAYLLGLTGPANNINTSCSTSLIAVIEACKNLSIRVCDMAIAGGISLLMPGQIGYIYREGMIASIDGHCRTFDKEASGTVSGSGVGVVLLKRLSDAIADSDNILAVIKGYSSNNDGDRKISYTAPSVVGQTECILNAQKMAGVNSNDIDYVECHGTATNLGDPIEIQALKEAFTLNENKTGISKQNGKCILGAVKANIGHANSAAGIAGLIKVCDMLQHNVIPGQINFNEANPELHINATNFEIIKQNKEWLPKKDRARIAGISSFGVGGTNAHVIISDYNVGTEQMASADMRLGNNSRQEHAYILPLSAKSKKSLEKYRQEFIKFLAAMDNNVTLEDIAYTLQQKREIFDYRLAITAKTKEEVISKLNSSKNEIIYNNIDNNKQLKTVFMFPGQGSQYANMCIDLYKNNSFFKDIVDNCVVLVNRQINIDFARILYPDIHGIINEDINQTRWAQMVLFIISYSLTKLLNNLNIYADSYIGHSIGEYVAAVLSG